MNHLNIAISSFHVKDFLSYLAVERHVAKKNILGVKSPLDA